MSVFILFYFLKKKLYLYLTINVREKCGGATNKKKKKKFNFQI